MNADIKYNFLQVEKDGKLQYVADSLGNQVMDFSYAGYHASEDSLPIVKAVVFVPHTDADSWQAIQQAIDHVSGMPVDKHGFRGAVLLDTPGVVLRGSGTGESGTRLLKKGVDRSALIFIEGQNTPVVTDTISLRAVYAPVNSRTLHLESATGLNPEESVMIYRPSTTGWIERLGCNHFGGGITALGWKAGDADIRWNRQIKKIEGNKITLDAPLSMAIDPAYGGGKLLKYSWDGVVSECGIENMELISDYNTAYPKDEDHCWTGISVENARDCWVRKVNFRHFAGSAVILQPSASRITVEDCISRHPVSEIGGLRRRMFYTLGQQTLFQRCFSENGMHDFAVGYCAAGPNAFVQCASSNSLGRSGTVDIWATGVLFDVVNIDGHNLSYKNNWHNHNGVGWTAGNSMFWQCTAAEIECFTPTEDAKNRAYGCWAQFVGDGEWMESNNHVHPRSLFYAQLKARTGADHLAQSRIMPMDVNATSSPTVEVAYQCMLNSRDPKPTLESWIAAAPQPDCNSAGIKVLRPEQKKNSQKQSALVPVITENGLLIQGKELLTGMKTDIQWWNGKLRDAQLIKAKPHVTRFVPSREGWGLTDRIDSVVDWMKRNNTLVLDHNYALWTDRRRDDHERIRRRDGDVWGPFYEQPFARSSEGFAWDGLSKYDLKRPNEWYWKRLSDFATLAQENRKLLFHENYFQHNILEAGAHWVDSPWRPANNINGTEFPEPVPFAGDKRIFMAEHFYNVDSPVMRELHRNYIRQCLNNFADHSNVVQLISAEYTGPLHFVEFWLDVIAEWEAETGKNALVALSTTKDVQDAILADSKRNPVVDIIDIRYWHYNTKELYAPKGGVHLAPRQHARKMKVGKVTNAEVFKAVSEYRSRFPEKAVMYYGPNYDQCAWSVFMAGGSCPAIPEVDHPAFKQEIVDMKPIIAHDNDAYKMVKSDKGFIIYYQSDQPLIVPVASGKYQIISINGKSGKTDILFRTIKGDQNLQLPSAPETGGIIWFRKK
ncbi:MAG: DUF6298 domain-containing protein [Bacteroidales bacterium]